MTGSLSSPSEVCASAGCAHISTVPKNKAHVMTLWNGTPCMMRQHRSRMPVRGDGSPLGTTLLLHRGCDPACCHGHASINSEFEPACTTFAKADHTNQRGTLLEFGGQRPATVALT